jgi:hypothetical protein
VPWEVEYTDEFGDWWESLTQDEQDRIAIAVAVLEEKGPGLGRPWVDTLEGSSTWLNCTRKEPCRESEDQAIP